MPRRQGCNANGVVLSSVFTDRSSDIDLAFYCSDDGMTRQEFADECDINNLMASYERTGVFTHLNRGQPDFYDASEVPDLQSAIDMLDRAESAFMRLPAAARREFDNSAVRFADFAADPANLPRMREWGLAPAAPLEPEPVVLPAEPPAAAPAASGT